MNRKAAAVLASATLGVSWAGLTTGSVAEAATAAPHPVVYNHAEGWGDPVTEPGNVTVGQGGSPYAGSLHWSYWAGFTARATGKYHQIAPGCTPTYQCPYDTRKVSVYLHRVRDHDGQAYFSRMRWTLTDGRVIHWRTDHGGYFDQG